MWRALITGATGFIGSYLVRKLLFRGWDITCLTRPESQTVRLKHLSVAIIRGSVTDHRVLENALQGQDYVFHLAAKIRGAG